MSTKLLDQDMTRYGMRKSEIPCFQIYFRKYQDSSSKLLKYYYKFRCNFAAKRNHVEISATTPIGGGLYIGHPFCITINPRATLGRNCNLHKGVTIGQENRGVRKGVPTIGNCVWIGVNSTIVGNIKIGNDVLIAPNTYVNCDVPDHSVVFGNPCIIKHRENATEHYINRRCEL